VGFLDLFTDPAAAASARARRRFAKHLARMRAAAHFAAHNGLDRKGWAAVDAALGRLAAGDTMSPEDLRVLRAIPDLLAPDRADARAALAAFARLNARGAIGPKDAPAFVAAHAVLDRIAGESG